MKIAIRRGIHAVLTEKMMEYLRGLGVGDDETLYYHDPRLVKCVEELDPEGWDFTDVPDEDIKEYYPLLTENDFMLLRREDLMYMLNHLIKIENENQEEHGSGPVPEQ